VQIKQQTQLLTHTLMARKKSNPAVVAQVIPNVGTVGALGNFAKATAQNTVKAQAERAAKSEPSKATLVNAPKQHHAYVEAMIDPWSTSDLSAPDEYRGGTCSYLAVDEYLYTPNAQGDLAFMIGPAMIQGIYNTTITAGTTAAAYSGAFPIGDYTALSGFGSRAKCLMYTVEVSYIGALVNSAGRICCVNVGTTAEYLSTSLASMFDDATCVCNVGDGMRCIQRSNDRPSMDVMSNVNFGANYLPYMFFAVTGAPTAANCIEVRVRRFLEYVPIRSTIMKNMTSVEPLVRSALDIAGNIGTDQADVVPNTAEGRKLQVTRAREMADKAWLLWAATAPSLGVPPALVAGLPALVSMMSKALKRLRN